LARWAGLAHRASDNLGKGASGAAAVDERAPGIDERLASRPRLGLAPAARQRSPNRLVASSGRAHAAGRMGPRRDPDFVTPERAFVSALERRQDTFGCRGPRSGGAGCGKPAAPPRPRLTTKARVQPSSPRSGRARCVSCPSRAHPRLPDGGSETWSDAGTRTSTSSAPA
jgi:hypothetical protein